MGGRGEGYVVVQVLLLIAVIFAPRLESINPSHNALRLVGVIFLLFGLLVAFLAIMSLGQNLTPLPHPKDKAQLVTSGVYAYVRHPIYSSILLLALGWAAWNASLFTLLATLILAIFFDLKARREERFLQQKFAAYQDYKMRVKKFIPYLY